MKTRTINFYAMLLISVGFAACQGTDKTGNAQLDSAPVGSSTDSIKMADTLKNPKDVTNMSKADGDGVAFIDSAALGGMMEVDLGKLALEKSENASVKKFAAQMVADHSKANTELKAIATKLGIVVADAYPAAVKTHMESMKKLSGKAFDRHYMDMMVNDHGKTIDLFRSATSLRPEIKDFATKTLPVLEKHNQMAKEVLAGLK